jgi:hypothetical protein
MASILLHDLGVSFKQFNRFNASHSITYYNLVIPTIRDRTETSLALGVIAKYMRESIDEIFVFSVDLVAAREEVPMET